MAGMNGFVHDCTSKKVEWEKYKNTLSNSPFSYAQIAIIWDFYVTRTFVGSSGQEIKLSEFGWDNSTSEKTLREIEKLLMGSAEVEQLCCIRSTTIKDTLSACDLNGDYICVSHPRIVLQQKYSVTIDENETIRFAGGGENRINCLFRHIRNAFAHSNTYFLDNGFVLLEDKDNSKVTARILIKQQTLLDWITIIDKNKKYYELVDVCSNCKSQT